MNEKWMAGGLGVLEQRLVTLRARVSDYLSVTKPAIALLNVFVGVATSLLALTTGSAVSALFLVGVAGFLAAGGAGALNCWLDGELDKRMTRTRHRPIPSGRVSPSSILLLGAVLSVSGVGLAVVYLNELTGFFVAMGIVWYILVYTLWLKPRTKWNIVVGGAAGSFSALAGWAAVTGSINLVSILIAILVFLWTPGHFWGLAIAKNSDYVTVGIPMLPVTDGIRRASIMTALSNILLLPFTLALYTVTANWTHPIPSILIGGVMLTVNIRFLLANIQLARTPGPLEGWKVFKQSVLYLFIILALAVVGHVF